MAIVKKAGPSPLPLTSSDYVAQNLLQTHDKLNLEQPIRISSTNVLQGALFQIGETYYYAESATAISGTPSDYVKITPSVDTLTATASFVANLTGVTWSASYGGYYDSSGNLYVFDEAKALQATAISTIMTRYVQQDSSGDVVIGGDLDVGGDLVDGTTAAGTFTADNLTVNSNFAANGSTNNIGNSSSNTNTLTGNLILDTENTTGLNVYSTRFNSSTTKNTVYDFFNTVIGGVTAKSRGCVGGFGTSEISSFVFNGGTTSMNFRDNSDTSILVCSDGDSATIGSNLDIFFIYLG